jgi:hypothetical protein
MHADRFVEALRQTIDDPILQQLPLTGGIDQWSDSTDFLHQREAIRAALNTLSR